MALRRYLKQGQAASTQAAVRLGSQAVALGLEPLDLALFHAEAVKACAGPDDAAAAKQGVPGRANQFFSEVLVPVEKTHGAALRNAARINQLAQKLHRCTVESSAAARHLKRSISRRHATEAAVDKSRKDRARLVKKSASLHTLLRHQTRVLLSVHEKERKKRSRQLQDQVAQNLLAISIGLLALKTSVKTNSGVVSKGVANTHRLVRKSLKKAKGVCV